MTIATLVRARERIGVEGRADLEAVIQLLCNTIASGEADETACYREIGKLLQRITEMQIHGRS